MYIFLLFFLSSYLISAEGYYAKLRFPKELIPTNLDEWVKYDSKIGTEEPDITFYENFVKQLHAKNIKTKEYIKELLLNEEENVNNEISKVIGISTEELKKFKSRVVQPHLCSNKEKDRKTISYKCEIPDEFKQLIMEEAQRASIEYPVDIITDDTDLKKHKRIAEAAYYRRKKQNDCINNLELVLTTELIYKIPDQHKRAIIAHEMIHFKNMHGYFRDKFIENIRNEHPKLSQKQLDLIESIMTRFQELEADIIPQLRDKHIALCNRKIELIPYRKKVPADGEHQSGEEAYINACIIYALLEAEERLKNHA